MGPRTLLKCKMRGIRLVRNRVSTMTAAFVVTVPLNESFSKMSLSPGFDVNCPSLPADGCGGGAFVEIDSACCEYTLRIVLWGKYSLMVQMKRRMKKAERRIFRDLRRRSSMVLIKAMAGDLPTRGAVLCLVEWNDRSP